VAEALAVAVGIVAPEGAACGAVDGRHIAVRGDGEHLVADDDGHDVARTEHIRGLAVVPRPAQTARAEVKAAEIGVPSTEDEVLAVDGRSGLTVIEE